MLVFCFLTSLAVITMVQSSDVCPRPRRKYSSIKHTQRQAILVSFNNISRVPLLFVASVFILSFFKIVKRTVAKRYHYLITYYIWRGFRSHRRCRCCVTTPLAYPDGECDGRGVGEADEAQGDHVTSGRPHRVGVLSGRQHRPLHRSAGRGGPERRRLADLVRPHNVIPGLEDLVKKAT